MPEILVICFLLIPQMVAAAYAKSIGKNPVFWFFISFLIPIISLLILLAMNKDKPAEKKGFKLADHVHKKNVNN